MWSLTEGITGVTLETTDTGVVLVLSTHGGIVHLGLTAAYADEWPALLKALARSCGEVATELQARLDAERDDEIANFRKSLSMRMGVA